MLPTMGPGAGTCGIGAAFAGEAPEAARAIGAVEGKLTADRGACAPAIGVTKAAGAPFPFGATDEPFGPGASERPSSADASQEPPPFAAPGEPFSLGAAGLSHTGRALGAPSGRGPDTSSRWGVAERPGRSCRPLDRGS